MNFTGYAVTDAANAVRNYEGAIEVTVDDNYVLTILGPGALVVATYAPLQWHMVEGIPAAPAT